MPQALSDRQRRAIHDLALKARTLLMTEAQEHLEGVYGLYEDGRIEPPNKLPQVQADPEKEETYRRLVQFLDDEARTGLSRPEAVEKLIKEVAFTHLNRLIAFKMMEAGDLIRGTLDKGPDSNAFKFYLADPDHADDLALYEQGEVDVAYRHFLLWQSGQIAQEIRVLFDPDTLVSRLLPRPRALEDLLDLLNDPALAAVWLADETVGWVYQYFNEPELQAAFEKVSSGSGKFEARDIPAATQLFTPHWIVRFLVQNTLGRLWVDLHPDTRLRETDLLDYLVPREGESETEDRQSKIETSEPLRPVKDITLLDPACGGMHFGLVAFDLFAAMYEEELARAGEPGWPDAPSIEDTADIPTAILKHNLFGIDLDLRAVQLSALALYLKAKSYNPEATITASNLSCADVTPLNGERLGTFVREARFKRPIYERLMRALWEKLQDAQQLGSLLRLEKELKVLIEEERARYRETPLFAGLDGEFEAEAAEEEFWDIISQQIVQGLNQFAREQAGEGVDQTFFAAEASKGLRLLDLMLRRYDVVATNPPYLSARKMNKQLKRLISDAYPEGKGDLYAAFIQRCLEFADDRGYVGMLTMHSFMFISSYEDLRKDIRSRAAVETMAHCGPALFEVGNPGTLQTTAFSLRKEPDALRCVGSVGAFLRLVHEPSGDKKRQSLEEALSDGDKIYRVRQRDFAAIPREPWVYWIPDELRSMFETLPALGDVTQPKQGLATADNFRFLRCWWEVGPQHLGLDCQSRAEAKATDKRWFPYMKGGGFKRWYGNQKMVVLYAEDGEQIRQWRKGRGYSHVSLPGEDYYFREGVTYSYLTSAAFSARLSPGGFIFDVAGSTVFPVGVRVELILAVLNSRFAAYALKLINPTVNFQIGDLSQLPVPTHLSQRARQLTKKALTLAKIETTRAENTLDFITPPRWNSELDGVPAVRAELGELEDRVNEEIRTLYEIGDLGRAAIKAELAGEPLPTDEGEIEAILSDDEEDLDAPVDGQLLAVRWISYAVGIALGRFQPGVGGALGSSVYSCEDFAIGSFPPPDQDQFDDLVGPPEHFAYVDRAGGRHVFAAEVECALRELAVDDGIAVLDEDHPRDLPALVSEALRLMIGDDAAREVIAEGAGGNLRQFLSKKFFTDWHVRWYSVSRRKAPIYWPVQSANLSCGFVLFHEKIDDTTLYVLQREYLDYKLNGLRQRIGDLAAREQSLDGSARKRVAREIQELSETLEEITTFAKTIDRIVREGYEPQSNWIDDGVILRMAPLWELIPIWDKYPRKYWKRLQEGEYDWSHIAMNYWPERVREACKENKSYAIAHRHLEWYEGD